MTGRYLVTGSAGHLGAALTAWIGRNHPGSSIIAVDDLSAGFIESVPSCAEFVKSDVADLPADLFANPFDAVWHFAAMPAECLSPFTRRFTYRNNLEATAHLVNRLIEGAGCGRFVFASTVAVYGNGSPPFDESAICVPNDPYAVSKIAAEQDLRIAGEQHGLDHTILRLHNVYGPGQNIWTKFRNVFGIWIRAALEGKPFTIFGDGTQRRAFSYIDDILPCLWEAAFAPQASKQTINLGGSEPIEIYRAADALAFAMGSEGPEIKFEPARHEVKDAWCSTAKSRELLGYEDRTELHTGLEAMWNWGRKAWQDFPERRHPRNPFEIELRRGLPAVWG